MVMGPQILTAIFLVTSKQPVKNSIAMLIGVVAAASVSLLIWYGLSAALGISPPSGSGPSTTDYVVAGLLALAALGYLLLGRRARDAMPRIRDWLTGNSWLVNLVVIVYFIFQLLK